MAARPTGKRHDTHHGTDQVAVPEAPPTRRVGAGGAARADRADDPPRADDSPRADDPPRADADLLDARERRQKPGRKAKGPAGPRLQDDDVLVDDRPVTETAPTDPE